MANELLSVSCCGCLKSPRESETWNQIGKQYCIVSGTTSGGTTMISVYLASNQYCKTRAFLGSLVPGSGLSDTGVTS